MGPRRPQTDPVSPKGGPWAKEGPERDQNGFSVGDASLCALQGCMPSEDLYALKGLVCRRDLYAFKGLGPHGPCPWGPTKSLRADKPLEGTQIP